MTLRWPTMTHSRWLSCQQIIATTTFGSTQTKKNKKKQTKKTNTYHKNSCKSNFVIYLLERQLCIGKSEIPFEIRLNNHKKDTKNPNNIEACKHFDNWSHVFHKHGKFILINKKSIMRTIR